VTGSSIGRCDGHTKGDLAAGLGDRSPSRDGCTVGRGVFTRSPLQTASVASTSPCEAIGHMASCLPAFAGRKARALPSCLASSLLLHPQRAVLARASTARVKWTVLLVGAHSRHGVRKALRAAGVRDVRSRDPRQTFGARMAGWPCRCGLKARTARSARADPRPSATEPLDCRGSSMRPRGFEPPRTIRSTRPSTLRVYQFRHRRVGRASIAPGRGAARPRKGPLARALGGPAGPHP
jgi:hypothetical protein